MAFFWCAEGLGDHPVQRQGRALGGRRALAFQAAGPLPADGRYELKVPYSVSRELLMDVLHYGSDAEIIEPVMLREQAKALLELALSNYEKS